MLAFNLTLLNREYNVKKCSEGLGLDHLNINSPCNPPVKDYTELIYLIYKLDVPSVQCKMFLRRSNSVREIDCLSLIFIDYYVRALTPCVNQAALELSNNIALFVLCGIYN
jgi:hypothetical protein